MGKNSNATRLVLFNHKGGVGKTSLSVQIAMQLGKLGKRILLVDTDPQCNLTSFTITEEAVDSYLQESDSSNGQTIWSALKPVAEAEGDYKFVSPIPLSYENVFILPGDIRLSDFESDLNSFWAECLQRKSKGFRGTTSISRLIDEASQKLEIDYVFYDSGPNIGPLNRAILLDCDFYIVPVACDLFSLRAIKTLGQTLKKWIQEWNLIASLAPNGSHLLPGQPKFLGYIAQGFKIYRQAPSSIPQTFLKKIENEINTHLILYLSELNPKLIQGKKGKCNLGKIQDYANLIAAAQSEGKSVGEVMVGSPDKRIKAERDFNNLAKKLLKLLPKI